MHRYVAYGVRITSTVALPGFVRSDTVDAPAFVATLPGDVPVGLGEVLRRRDEDDNSDAVEVRRPAADALHLSFADGATFYVDAAARRIDGAFRPPLTFDDALVYLVGPALGAALRLLRRSVLHASAVEVDGRALLVMGEAGAGKSTMTAALVDRGCPLVTEDVSALDVEGGSPRVLRGGTRVKLWPESVRALRGRDDALPLLVPDSVDWHKRFLDCSGHMCREDALPIAAILSLERGGADEAPHLTPVTGHDKLLALLANGYAARMVRPDDRAAELARLTSIAQHVPLFRMSYADSFAALDGAAAAAQGLVAGLG